MVGEGAISHRGRHYTFDNVAITPRPVQQPIPAYVASFSKPSIELAARLGCGLIVAPFAAALTFGGLQQVRELYQETCAKHGTQPGRLMCSYFTHFADDHAQEQAARARRGDLKECVIPTFPAIRRRRWRDADRKSSPPPPLPVRRARRSVRR